MLNFYILEDGIKCFAISFDEINRTINVKNINKDKNKVINLILNEKSSFEDVEKFLNSRVNLRKSNTHKLMKDLNLSMNYIDAIKLTKGRKHTDTISIEIVQ